jgi:hypothetical protein
MVILGMLSGGASAQNTPDMPPMPPPFVSTLFSYNMVLQRGKVNTVWGWPNQETK